MALACNYFRIGWTNVVNNFVNIVESSSDIQKTFWSYQVFAWLALANGHEIWDGCQKEYKVWIAIVQMMCEIVRNMQ